MHSHDRTLACAEDAVKDTEKPAERPIPEEAWRCPVCWGRVGKHYVPCAPTR